MCRNADIHSDYAGSVLTTHNEPSLLLNRYPNSSNNVFASCRYLVSKPSVNLCVANSKITQQPCRVVGAAADARVVEAY